MRLREVSSPATNSMRRSYVSARAPRSPAGMTRCSFVEVAMRQTWCRLPRRACKHRCRFPRESPAAAGARVSAQFEMNGDRPPFAFVGHHGIGRNMESSVGSAISEIVAVRDAFASSTRDARLDVRVARSGSLQADKRDQQRQCLPDTVFDSPELCPHHMIARFCRSCAALKRPSQLRVKEHPMPVSVKAGGILAVCGMISA